MFKLTYLNMRNVAKGSHPKQKVMFLWTLSVPPLAPPPRIYGHLGGSFFLTRTSDSRQLEKKARRLPFLVNLYFLMELITCLCKNIHVLVVISDFWCYFHPKIASVKLVKTPPKAMEWG